MKGISFSIGLISHPRVECTVIVNPAWLIHGSLHLRISKQTQKKFYQKGENVLYQEDSVPPHKGLLAPCTASLIPLKIRCKRILWDLWKRHQGTDTSVPKSDKCPPKSANHSPLVPFTRFSQDSFSHNPSPLIKMGTNLCPGRHICPSHGCGPIHFAGPTTSFVCQLTAAHFFLVVEDVSPLDGRASSWTHCYENVRFK